MGGVKYSVYVFCRLQNVTDAEAISLTLREFLWPFKQALRSQCERSRLRSLMFYTDPADVLTLNIVTIFVT